MICKTTKIDYKVKDAYFDGDVLMNENGEPIDLVKELKTLFGYKPFTISVSLTEKEDIELEKNESEDDYEL